MIPQHFLRMIIHGRMNLQQVISFLHHILVSKNECFYIENNICAYFANTDSCQADSGGPLIKTGTNSQVGIVSWGYGCNWGVPAIYTKVGLYSQWINDIITLFVGSAPFVCPTTPITSIPTTTTAATTTIAPVTTNPSAPPSDSPSALPTGSVFPKDLRDLST